MQMNKAALVPADFSPFQWFNGHQAPDLSAAGYLYTSAYTAAGTTTGTTD
jgi:hypothetical protein